MAFDSIWATMAVYAVAAAADIAAIALTPQVAAAVQGGGALPPVGTSPGWSNAPTTSFHQQPPTNGAPSSQAQGQSTTEGSGADTPGSPDLPREIDKRIIDLLREVRDEIMKKALHELREGEFYTQIWKDFVGNLSREPLQWERCEKRTPGGDCVVQLKNLDPEAEVDVHAHILRRPGETGSDSNVSLRISP